MSIDKWSFLGPEESNGAAAARATEQSVEINRARPYNRDVPFGNKKHKQLFGSQVEHYAAPVLQLSRYAVESNDVHGFPSREFLNRWNGAATRLEELLDHHGAQHNEHWFPFREAVAAAKLFSNVAYAVRHVHGSFSRYTLIDLDVNCETKTDDVLVLLREAIVKISEDLIALASGCGIDSNYAGTGFEPRTDPEVTYKLPADREVRHSGKVGEVVVHLASHFLNLAEDRDVRAVLSHHECPACRDLIPEPISEESLRNVEARFHNLQSLYDTYLFESDLERQNADLRYLRGHISIIYHLAEIATNLVHYYVRHMSVFRRESAAHIRFPMDPENLLEMVFDYPLKFARLYLESAVQLCRRMIKSYSVQTNIEVPIPYYRGFHVRPSTLIAKIVAHYGSEVKMTLNGREYDAATPLELFRANEDINAMKRRFIADVLCRDPEFDRPLPQETEERIRQLQLLFVKLVKQNKIIMYDGNLDIEESNEVSESTVAELAVRVIRHLVSVAKMDVRSDLKVTFTGDNRALKDLGILAHHGYGEDQMGNNIVLPDELSYLSR